MKPSLLSLFLLALALPALAQEKGQPLIRLASPPDGDQTWSIFQDKRGVLLLGQSLGLWEYDGAAFRKLDVKIRASRIINTDETGRIWAGGTGRFGYLEPDAKGHYEFHSLEKYVPENTGDFTDIWQIVHIPGYHYFRSYQRLFGWDGNKMKVWRPKGRFQGIASHGGKIYVSDDQVGLTEMVGDSFQPIPGGEIFKGAVRLNFLPWDNGELLIASRSTEPYLFDGKSFRPFPTPLAAKLKEASIYNILALPDGGIVIGTLRGGTFVLNHDGSLRRMLNPDSGLPADNTYSTTLDRDGALWIGMSKQIARVDLSSNYTLFPKAVGFTGITRHNGSIYLTAIGGASTVARLVENPQTGVYEPRQIPTPFNQAWRPLLFRPPGENAKTQLLLPSQFGIQRVDGDRIEPIIPGSSPAGSSTRVLIQSRRDPNRVFAALFGGMTSVRWDGSRWQDEGNVPNFSPSLLGLAEDDDGSLWSGTESGVAMVRPGSKVLQDATVRRMGVADGLTEDNYSVARIDNEIFAISLSSEHQFRWDKKAGRFVEDRRFQIPLDKITGSAMFQLPSGNIAAFSISERDFREGIFLKTPNGYQLRESPLNGDRTEANGSLYEDADGALWSTGNILRRIHPSVFREAPKPFRTVIRQVSTTAGELIAGGFPIAAPSLPNTSDSIVFQYAGLSFEAEDSTRYQFQLKGSDAGWSPWATMAEARYNGLGPGTYTFEVKSRTLSGREGSPDSFTFTILPPWYRSNWAYAAYALFMLGALYAGRRLIIHHERDKAARESAALEAQARALEATVAERTAQISAQRDNIARLSGIGQQITASLDLDTVLFRLYEQINQIVDASIFGVGLHRPELGVIEYTLAIENGKRYAPYTRSLADKSQFPVWVVDHRQPILINDIEAEASRYVANYQHMQRLLEDGTPAQAPASMIYLPLIAQDRVLGVLSVQSFRKNAYTPEHLSLLENLATFTTIALDNSSAYKLVEQRAAELATVNRITQALSTQLDKDAIIQLVGEQVRQTFRAPLAYVAMLDTRSMMIHFPYIFGEQAESRPFGEGLTSQILRTGEPLLINSNIDDARSRMGVKAMGAPSASYLGVPIKAGTQTIGVISVQSTDEENRFTEADQRLLMTIASSVGVSFHNAQLFEEAQRARAAAEEADAAKGSFLSTVSHELRTPLTSVLGFAKIIRRRLQDRLFPLIPEDDRKIAQTKSQVLENLDVVVSEGERLTKLIDDVLDLAKIEAGKFTWNMGPVSLNEVLDRALTATASLFDAKQLTLVRDIPPELPSLTGDHDRLIQVVINLISNAVKFTPAGEVRCSARQEGNQLVVSVADSGIGIAPADQPKVFEKFKQVGDTLTDKPKGTGLGLPICKDIVEHHGGRIWVESEPGQGSTFSFSLPLDPAAPAPAPASARNFESLMRELREKVDQTPSHGRSILVVDDDPSIRSLLEQEFTEAGYAVRLATNGREALDRVREEAPGLIVLDVMMPEMNGFDVAAVLKNDPATMHIPIIILSIVEDKERGFRLGIDRYLTKPINTENLFREVGALLEQGQSHKKVMVVDEDASTLRTLTDVLQTRGYQVVEANGDDLLSKAVTTRPDIIILSSLMSSQSEAVRSLRFEKGLENVLFLIYQ